jgi:hypothetical protein
MPSEPQRGVLLLFRENHSQQSYICHHIVQKPRLFLQDGVRLHTVCRRTIVSLSRCETVHQRMIHRVIPILDTASTLSP